MNYLGQRSFPSASKYSRWNVDIEIKLFFIVRLYILISFHFLTNVVHQMQYFKKKKSRRVSFFKLKTFKMYFGFIFIVTIVKNEEAFRSSIFLNNQIKVFLFWWLVGSIWRAIYFFSIIKQHSALIEINFSILHTPLLPI